MTRKVTTAVRTGKYLLLVGALLAIAACGGGGQAGGSGGTGTEGGGTGTAAAPTQTGTGSAAPTTIPTPITVQGTEIQYHGQRSVVGKSSTTIELYDNYFEPSVLIGSPGQQLSVDLVNEGQIEHTFTIESQGIDAVLGPGESTTVQVTFPESNRKPFICTYHVAAGMAGILAVTG